MKKNIFYLIGICIIIIFLPYVIAGIYHNISIRSHQYMPYDGRVVLLPVDSDVTTPIDYNQYLYGMVARNLISFDETVLTCPDFVRLNILLANTYLKNEFENTTILSNEFLQNYYIEESELIKVWGSNYSAYHDYIISLITEMSGKYLGYSATNDIQNGTPNIVPIHPYFHRISCGQTRIPKDSDALNLSYLKSADTSQDLEEAGFLSITTLSYNDFAATLQEHYPSTFTNLSAEQMIRQIQIASKTNEYVDSVLLGSTTVSGEEFANLFSLNSTCFSFNFQKDHIKIITKGIGHGYGISLSYACRMLENGSTLEDVLQYFYQDVHIISNNSFLQN